MHMPRRIIIFHNAVTEIKKMLKRSQIGTPNTFCRDMSSIITMCAGSVQKTNEPLQHVYLNPIPVWKLATEGIWSEDSFRVQQP